MTRSVPLMPPRQSYYYVQVRGSDGRPVSRAVVEETNCGEPCTQNAAQPFPPVPWPDQPPVIWPLNMFRPDTGGAAMSQGQYRIIAAGLDCDGCVPNVPIPFPPVIAPDVKRMPGGFITRAEAEARYVLRADIGG